MIFLLIEEMAHRGRLRHQMDIMRRAHQARMEDREASLKNKSCNLIMLHLLFFYIRKVAFSHVCECI